jgi:aryl-phospho-beta-D-glucosidase BglC (GH1 family)
MRFTIGGKRALSAALAMAPLLGCRQEPVSTQQYVEAMAPGWNLGNTFEAAGNESSWGNPATTREMIRLLKASGYNSIRIPVFWGKKHLDWTGSEWAMGDAPDYAISPGLMARVKQVVDWSLEEGLYVMLNMHHDCCLDPDEDWISAAMSDETHDEIIGKYKKIWTQIAAAFKDYSSKLSFESINEPQFGGWSPATPQKRRWLDDIQTAFYETVRGSGGKNRLRPLSMTTYTGSTDQADVDALWDTMSKFGDDRNLIAQAHYYGQYHLSSNNGGMISFEQCLPGGTGENVGRNTRMVIDRLYNKFVKNGIPVVIGEMGLFCYINVLGQEMNAGEARKFFEDFCYYAASKGILCMVWDHGGGSGFSGNMNRPAHPPFWNDPYIPAVMSAAVKGIRSSSTAAYYPFPDRDYAVAAGEIYLKRGSETPDVTQRLNLNGNTLVDIRVKSGDEWKTLGLGTDYTVDEAAGTITFRGVYLGQFKTGRYGVKNTLTLRFSAGLDWTIDIIYHDTPGMTGFSGERFSARISTRFRGSRLATLRAEYRDNPNPSNKWPGNPPWTRFKQFNSSYRPGYATGTISLNKDLFDSMDPDRDVNLTFYFWSGEKIDYTVRRSGDGIVEGFPVSAETGGGAGEEEGDGGAEPGDVPAPPGGNADTPGS